MFHRVIVPSWSVFILCVLGAMVLVAGSDTYGDDGGKQAPPIGEKDTPEYPNLDSRLRALLEAFEAGAYSDDDAVGAPEDGLPTVQKDPAVPLPPVGPKDPAVPLPTAGPVDPGDWLPTEGEKSPADPLPPLGPKDPENGLPPVDVTLYVIGTSTQ